ncbi:retrovirus-related Pol polyprotein from transposon 17.6 [Trichonephila clavipes]|nr:retrovirus-related Pol polyprotein from transposon 17.6 [Trichonephila clavipes]
MFKNALKEDLIRVVEDLDDERVSRNESEATLEKQKIELAKLQLAQLEKEVELQTAKNKALSLNPAAKVEEKQFETNIENMIKSIKTLSLPVPTRSENFNLFFQSLERAFLTKKINDEYKSEILINLLGERAHNVLLYIKKEELNDYEKLKSIVLREFQETATHIGIREAEDWFRPIDLAKEYDIYISSRSGSPRRLSCSEKLQVNDQIDDWLQQGIIRESCSDYCSPIVLCKKKDGNLRICIDYRKINSKTDKDRYPLPLIEEVLDQLQSGNFFSIIDLKNGFFHVEMEESSKKFTSFVTHNGQYEFNKVPFGLCNSPSVFQRFINHVFRDLLKEGIVIIYMDDIIIPSSDELDGLNRLTRVLKTASEYGLELNLKKCNFLKSKIEFLGHIIEKGTIKPSLDKTKAVQNFPEPKNVKQVQSFLGLSGYFRKFIQNYSIIAKPLSDLLRDNAVFHFGTEQQLAFQTFR